MRAIGEAEGRARRLTALVLCALVGGCRGGGDAEGTPAADAGASAAAPGSAQPPRRPSKRYFMVRTQKRCEVYWTEGDRTSDPIVTACPAHVEVGERIRIAGKTCLREGGAPERHQPVVCPDALTNAEKWDREGLPWGAEKASPPSGSASRASDAGR